MQNIHERPSFIYAWLTDIRDDYSRGGIIKLVPWQVAICCAIGAAASYFLPKNGFWDKPEIPVAFFAAAITINGLLLALAWSSFSKTYEIASSPGFSGYLREKNLLNNYIFIVDYIHFTQITALLTSATGLVGSIIWEALPRAALPVLFGATIATSIYAVRYALGAVRVMQDLVWNRSTYDQLTATPNGSRPIRVHDGGKGS